MLSTTQPKSKGNLSSVFAHLGASKPEMDPRFLDLKQAIAPQDPVVLCQAFDRLLQKMEVETAEIQRLGSMVIPEVDFQEIQANGGRMPERLVPEIKKRGVVVVRGILDREVSKEYKALLVEYIQKHREELTGFPEDDPQAWEVYWSQTQMAARAHPHFTETAVALNHLWHTNGDYNVPIDLSKNLIYCDRLRIRQPGDQHFRLQGHIDGGSVERWEDPEYRSCYTKILEGKWEEHDPYDVTHRIGANMDLYDSPGGCSAFRIFQGWLAISTISTGGGTIRVCPLVKEATAYFMMKPLLGENKDKSEFMGAWPSRCQDITEEHHPHIVNAMVSIPDVDFGDGVFWHCDMVHAVEDTNNMANDSSVLYIPSTPLCPRNSQFIRRQRTAFELGRTPPDFPANNCEKDFDDRSKPETLDYNQKRGMGFLPFSEEEGLNPGQAMAILEHNKIIAT